jgi:hypothetical protein
MKGRHLLLVAASLAVSCSTARQAPVPISDDRDLIAAVVLQHLVKTHGYLGTPFLCVWSQEPPADVFRAVQRAVPVSVLPCSEAGRDAAGVVNRVTGERGVILNVWGIKFGDIVVVKGGYHCGNLCAAEYEYQMGSSPQGEWRIIRETMLWIS